MSLEDLEPLLAACHLPGLASLQELDVLCASFYPLELMPQMVSFSHWLGACAVSAAAHPNLCGYIWASLVFFEIILQSSAAWAPKLRLLKGAMWDLVSGRAFPVMSGLKHLMLSVMEGPGLCELVAALPQMPQLETLHLAHYPTRHAKTPRLNFMPCTKLQSL